MTRINRQIVKDYVDNNPELVRRSESERFPGLFVLKYTNKVFYKNLWNEVLEDMRGTVVDKDYNPVVMPFRKIYNHHERGVTIPRDCRVLASRKINGFMAAATYVPYLDKVIVSTTGSLDSPFVAMAEDYITQEIKDKIKEFTLRNVVYTHLFEVVHENDQTHPIKEELGLYYLGARFVSWDGAQVLNHVRLDDMANELGVKRPEWFCDRFSNIVQHNKTVKHEGFVVEMQEQPYIRLKLKSPFYLTTKWLGRMSNQKLDSLAKDPEHFKRSIDEDLAPVIDFVVQDLETYKTLTNQEKFDKIKEFLNG